MPMTIAEVQKRIQALKQERNICVLAHSYQAREILEIADITGDSYQLSVQASHVHAASVLMCGVRFMAETVKILSPEKQVYLANPTAGCPMAEQMEPEMIAAVKAQYPHYTVVAYINTTAALKAISDVCVTSSSAVSIVRRLDNDNILFIPDCNLGAYVAAQVPEKNIKLLQGGCPIHATVTVKDVTTARARYPDAPLLIHPECVPAVVAQADFVGSTAEIMRHAMDSDNRTFLIGTEMSIAEHLQYMAPDKNFYPLSQKLLCPNMKATTLMDVLHMLEGTGGEEIVMDTALMNAARRCITEMVRLGE